MKEAIVRKDTSVNIIHSPVPRPGLGHVLIKVVVAGSNPKDWKLPVISGIDSNSGDDIAGTIEAVGEDVVGFRKGDRVAASVSAATIPLVAYTSVCALFQQLELPEPWGLRSLIIYGASTATGAFAIKLAAAANIHPIIAVGSKRSEFVKPFLDETKGDILVDYTAYPTENELVQAIQDAVKTSGAPDGRCWKAYDTVSEDETVRLLTKVLAGPPNTAAAVAAAGQRPKVVNIFMKTEVPGSDPSVDIVFAMVAQVHSPDENDKLIGVAWGAVFTRGLRQGWLTAHPYTVATDGLESLSEGLRNLKDGKIRGQKFLTRPGETPGASG
ncbi:hypothetical protein BJX66DRAFT_330575 [Aspergillus keveii]|uniref:Alcohol dehydrogenase-like N-terminal domain-containing protein n=1 Tax=Aspergillus keveii TaxID=714993 RepID=A0ABR4FJS0_9EURO